KQVRDAGACCRFRDRRGEIAAGHRRRPYIAVQHVTEDVATALPFVQQLRPRAVAHSKRVGARMAADHMSARMQLADLRLVEKPARADVVRRDEEMADESVALEDVG